MGHEINLESCGKFAFKTCVVAIALLREINSAMELVSTIISEEQFSVELLRRQRMK